MLPASAARTCFGADAAVTAGACCGVIGVVMELAEDGWVFVFGPVTTGCVATEGMDAELLRRSDLEVEAEGEVVTLECAGTEAAA